MKYIIGVDIGTQGTKAALLDENLVVKTESFKPSRLIYPAPGAVEQKPSEILYSCLFTIKDIMEKSGISPASVCGICIDGQMAGIMGIDRNGDAVTPYLSWLDQRCDKYLEITAKRCERRVIELTGCPVTYAHGPRILWLKNEYPDTYRKIYKFIQPAAYCTMKLCGYTGDWAFIDYTYLHFSGFADTANKTWSEELLSEFDVDQNLMPQIVAPWEVIGCVSQAMAHSCGLMPGTPVCAGCGDTAASAFGAGMTKPGVLFDVAGTACVLACAVNGFHPDLKNKTILFAPSVVKEMYTPMAYINGGGLCLRWLRDNLGAKDYAQLDKEAGSVPPGSQNLIFLPHFAGRVCPNDPLLRGCFAGLTLTHNRAHMFRAVMEGIAYEYGIYLDVIRELNPGVKFERVISVGGGAGSGLFNQIKADVLGLPVNTINRADTAVIGCAAIAGYAVGLFSSLTAPVEAAVSLRACYLPNKAANDTYKKYTPAYKECINAMSRVSGLLLR